MLRNRYARTAKSEGLGNAGIAREDAGLLLPDLKITTGPWDFRPIKQLRLIQFDGRTWQPIGDVFETAFSGFKK
jgi:branched-chain amino acid transport system substrate-binding protein